MSDLELLWLNDNKLTSIPGSLTDLTKLTDLDLSWNSIKGSIPAEITKVPTGVCFLWCLPFNAKGSTKTSLL
jgi:Leucine-rich repeat (LRR) protein